MDIKELVAKAVSSIQQKSHVIMDKVDILLQKPTLSVQELAGFIVSHHEVSFSERELLGLQFYTYDLFLDQLHFHLETKGDYILQVTIASSKELLFEFNSYDSKHSAGVPLKLPDLINSIVN